MKQKHVLAQEDYMKGMKCKELAEKKAWLESKRAAPRCLKVKRTNCLAVTLQTYQSILGFVTGDDETKKFLKLKKSLNNVKETLLTQIICKSIHF